MYVPSNPHEAYKMGVEEAIREIQENMPLPRTKDPVDVLNAIPSFVRKKLLTKKVIKWVVIYAGDERLLFPDSKLWDSKEEADSSNKYCANYRGGYPIEIETEL